MSKYSIRAVVKETGLSSHAIRVWERRYQAITPFRTSTGHRRYSDEEVERLKLLKLLTDWGHRIGNIANLSSKELKSLSEKSSNIISINEQKQNHDSPEINKFLRQSLYAIEEMNQEKLDNILKKSLVEFSKWKYIHQLIIPLLHLIGQKWEKGEMHICEEHIASQVIETNLRQLCSQFSLSENSPTIVMATPCGYMHELGILIASLVSLISGYRPIQLGCSVPMEEIARVCKKTNSKNIAFSLMCPTQNDNLLKDFDFLRNLITPDIDIIVGGNGCKKYKEDLEKMNIKVLNNLKDFRNYLS